MGQMNSRVKQNVRSVLETSGSERSESGMFCVEESGVVVESALKISEMEMWVWMVCVGSVCGDRCDRDGIGYHSGEG